MSGNDETACPVCGGLGILVNRVAPGKAPLFESADEVHKRDLLLLELGRRLEVYETILDKNGLLRLARDSAMK